MNSFETETKDQRDQKTADISLRTGGFRSVLCVSLFQGSLLVIVIMIDGRWLVNFRVRMFVKSAVKSPCSQ